MDERKGTSERVRKERADRWASQGIRIVPGSSKVKRPKRPPQEDSGK